MVTRRSAATPEAVARALRSGEAPPPLLLAAGPSDYWRDEVARAYRNGAAATGAESARLEGDELDAATLAAALESLSLFATERRLWIREGAKIEKACEERLLAWADAPAAGLSILLTTARDPAELKFLAALAAKATVVTCEERAGDAAREAERMAREAGITLPPGLAGALVSRAPSLLALRQEMGKLAVRAEAGGKLPASALDVVAGGHAGASVDRWAAAALRGDGAATRAEAAALTAEGVSAGNALWAVASVALGALEPQGYGYGYRGGARGGAPAPSLRPAAARAALDAVYRADRAMKRGEIRDEEVLDVLERKLREGLGGASVRDA